VRTSLAELLLPQSSPLNGEVYDKTDADRLSSVLKALADPARLRLLSLIQASPDGEACVCDLTAPIGLSQPTVSHHLRILTESGLLEREKRGVWAYYRLVPSAIQQVAELLTPPRKRATKRGGR
jgi:ArsR family transcriptional regulator